MAEIGGAGRAVEEIGRARRGGDSQAEVKASRNAGWGGAEAYGH